MFNNQIVSSINLTLPTKKILNKDIFEINPKIDNTKIKTKFGTEVRYWCNNNESFFTLAKNSINKVQLDNLNIKFKFLILVTQSSESTLPGIGQRLVYETELPEDIYILEINQGCAGFPHAMYSASLLAEDLGAGLIVCGDTYSKFLDHNDTSTLPIFGDGVCSILINNFKENSKRGIIRSSFSFFSNGKLFDRLILKNSPINSNQKKLYMDGIGVFNFVIKSAGKILDKYSLDSYDKVYLHQASKFTFDELIRRKNIKDKCPVNLHKYGNLTSASLPALWHDDFDKNKPKDRLLFVGFGVGLSCGVFEYVQ